MEICIENYFWIILFIRMVLGMKLIKILSIMMYLMMLNGCGMWQGSDKQLEKVGVAKSEEENGSQIVVEATVVDDKLIKIRIDETGAKSFDGSMSGTKKELGDDYNMRSFSDIGKEWYEQINALELFIEEYGLEAVTVDSDGRATNDDLKTSCTISVEEYLDVAEDAVYNAKNK